MTLEELHLDIETAAVQKYGLVLNDNRVIARGGQAEHEKCKEVCEKSQIILCGLRTMQLKQLATR